MKNKGRLCIIGTVAVIGLACSFLSGTIPPTETALPATTTPTQTQTQTQTVNHPPAETETPYSEISPTRVPLFWIELDSRGDFPRDPVTAFVSNPEEPEIVYAGTQNAGVYKSYNAGKTWRPVRKGLGTATISRLLIDPSKPQTLYASTGSPVTGPGYAYKTTDAGKNWQRLATSGPGGSLVMDGADPERLYFQIDNWIEISEDGGQTWTQNPDLPAQIWDIYGHPTDAKVLFATPGPSGEGFYRSEDGGRTWDRIELDEYHLVPILIGTGPAGREVMYAVAQWDDQLFASSDDGRSWKEIAAGCRTVGVDHKTPTTIYCGTDYSLKFSIDSGGTWSSKPHPGGRLSFLGFSADGSSLLIQSAAGAFLSYDSGTTWSAAKDGLGEIKSSLQMDAEHRIVYAEDALCNVFRSPEAALDWDLIHTDACGLSIGFGGDLYLGDGRGDLFHSANGGGAWSTLTKPFEEIQRVIPIASPRDKNRIWAISTWPEFFFHRSQDGGRTWISVPESEAPKPGIFLFPPAPSRTIYEIGGGPGYVSDDDGETWKPCVGKNIGATSAILDPFDPKVIYTAERGFRIAVSPDGCRSWRDAGDGPGNLFINSLAADPDHEGRLYAGTDAGVFVSFNSGADWVEVNEGFPSNPVVYSIVIDAEGCVIAATPEGFYQLAER